MTPLLGYALCALVALILGAALWHIVKVRPLEREREKQNSEVGRLRAQVAAIASEQLRIRGWNRQETPTIRP